MLCLELCKSLCKVSCKDISYTKTITAYLVSVCRTDTLECRTDLALTHCSLVGCIEKSVSRQDEMCLLCNHDSLIYRNACLCSDVVAFTLEGDRVKNYSVSYDVCGILSEDT